MGVPAKRISEHVGHGTRTCSWWEAATRQPQCRAAGSRARGARTRPPGHTARGGNRRAARRRSGPVPCSTSGGRGERGGPCMSAKRASPRYPSRWRAVWATNSWKQTGWFSSPRSLRRSLSDEHQDRNVACRRALAAPPRPSRSPNRPGLNPLQVRGASLRPDGTPFAEEVAFPSASSRRSGEDRAAPAPSAPRRAQNGRNGTGMSMFWSGPRGWIRSSRDRTEGLPSQSL